VQGGMDGAPNVVRIHRNGSVIIPEHLSKDQDIALAAGDRVEVLTPGGGGYGDPFEREPELVRRDVVRGYYTPEAVRDLFGVAIDAAGEVNAVETMRLRGNLKRRA
jgi:N-methylhydantoinase B